MFHILAYLQSVDQGNALTAVTAVREEMFFTNGPDFRVPAGLTKIAAAWALANDGSLVRAQLQAPSLRVQTNIDIEPFIQAANFGLVADLGQFSFDTPMDLVEDEALNLATQSDPAAPVIVGGLVLLADNPLQPVSGKVFTVRCTATVAQSAVAWVNGNLTLGQVLPAGEYAVVGARFRSADAVAGRLVFSAQNARPGLPSISTVGGRELPRYRAGGLGVWGTFPNTIPPTVDFLGGAAATQVVFLDLMRIS